MFIPWHSVLVPDFILPVTSKLHSIVSPCSGVSISVISSISVGFAPSGSTVAVSCIFFPCSAVVFSKSKDRVYACAGPAKTSRPSTAIVIMLAIILFFAFPIVAFLVLKQLLNFIVNEIMCLFWQYHCLVVLFGLYKVFVFVLYE